MARAALWCALALVAGAAAYTIDCNHEYTDCDTELSKLTAEDDDVALPSQIATATVEKEPVPPPSTSTAAPTRSTPQSTTTVARTVPETTEEDAPSTESYNQKARARLLNLNVDELKNFAIDLHNQTELNNKKLSDISDVTLDDEVDDDKLSKIGDHVAHKGLPDRFYSNLQAPFHSMVPSDHFDEAANEAEMCKENDVTYKVGDRMDRGCEETCECMPTGQFICAPRCKHPYIRRGRHLSDPLCFESPVDECCSIIACATGNGDMKVAKLEVCKYGNDTYLVGNTWNVGCEQRCSCEKNSVVTCKPRCPPLPQSDKCINVQDPNDACCEVQVCDVSQDVHEEEADNVTNSTTVSAEKLNPMEESPPTTMRPLVLMEPIGSIKVLQNNSVQVTLIHTNSSEDPIHLLLSSDGGSTFKDVELKYDNLILNLDGGKDYILKTKETGTKFNFTITSTEVDKSEALEELVKVDKKIGCTQDEKFYEVGEEFHIGCSELCECTGDDTRECVALECPSHVGLELMSKGCVKWAPSPPPTPPNCCPRAARCLSDGTCHYKGVPIPNWTDVPVSLSGCSTRCFCENGELDCQEVCSPLPPLPPQSLRCPPAHRPAPVNISDEDCCQQWGCVPNAGKGDIIHPVTTAMHSAQHHVVYPPRLSKPVDNDFYRRQNQAQTLNKLYKPFPKTPVNQYRPEIPNPDNIYIPGIPKDYSSENMTVFDFDHLHIPSQNDAVVILSNNSYSNTGRHQEEQSDPLDSPFPKPVVIAKQPVYKYIQSSLPEVILPPQTKPRNKDIKQSHSLKPNQNLPSHKSHQPTYFTPASKNNNRDVSLDFKQSKIYDKTSGSYIPFRNNSIQTPERFELPLPVKEFLPDSEIREHGRYMTAVKRPEKPKQMTDNNRWEQNTKLHVLTKLPNPYETVLLRAVQKAQAEPSYLYDYHNAKPYPGLDLENLLSQEVESGVSRNLERSADKKRLTAAGQPPSSDVPTTQQVPQVPFLPTVPPTDSGNIHFSHDVGEVDYDQNNIHRPVNPLVPGIPGFPPGLPVAPSGDENKKLTVITLVSDSPTSVKMLFGLPPVLVGLRGSVDLRYTDKADEEITHWYSQVFAPADEILTTSRLEFRLTGLKPSTVYKLRGKLYLHNLPVEPESEIYTIRTQDLPTIAPVEEKRREIDSRLTVLDVNDTVAHITWRRFTEEELQFIDAIQVRYRPVGNPLYSMTELLHHSRAAASLHELRPGSRYEASLVLVPPPRATTELTDPTVVEFTTAPYVDPYNWSVQLEARSVGSEAAELTWKGIPSPAERWVRVYRAAHACGNNHREHDAFRLATRDLPPAITLSGLEPDTRCRVWLELFLTNGKVKTSNVLEINTKSLDSPEPIDNAIEASSIGGRGTAPRGDYYGALVVVGVVAALGALTSLLLLLVVVRRHRPRSVPITPVPTAPRESSLPPYDNPAYKLELQQETMDL